MPLISAHNTAWRYCPDMKTRIMYTIKIAALSTLGLFSFKSVAPAQVNPVYIADQIRLDGRLTEPAWDRAEIITGFTQKELKEGAPATEKTEVRIMYDDEKIYIGFFCYDSEPDKIVHKLLKRDDNLKYDDSVDIVIDTYNDSRMGYIFSTNPNGIMFDGTLQAVGTVKLNSNWDGIWDVRSYIGDSGWSCEIEIPFKTLRFPNKDMQEWGINFKRVIARKNEESLWRNWRRNEGIIELSRIGTITLDRTLASGRQVDIKPYVLTGAEKERGEKTGDTFKYGVDVKYGITNNTTLDLTTNTDFAQIESDQEVINLTRHKISYPEKRDFFLEGADTFDFSQGRMKMFYSRSIGLSPDRELLPILAGAKLTQKAGDYRLGAISVQTGEKNGVPSTNYSAVRFKKDILKQSFIGMIATSVYDENGHDNQLIASDLGYKTTSFLGGNNLEIQGYLGFSMTDGDGSDSRAARLSFTLPNDTYRFRTLYHAREKDFNPGVGFADRLGVQEYLVGYDLTPRVNVPYIKKLLFSPLFYKSYNDMQNTMMSSTLRISPFGFVTESDDEFTVLVTRQFEFHDETFDLFEDVTIPVGEYDWWQTEMTFVSSKRRTIAFDTSFLTGDYYNGTRMGYDMECIFKTNSFYSLSADVRYNSIDTFGRSFETKEVGSHLTLDFSTRLFTTTFIQWNNETKEMNANFRLHYIPKIGSDIYIVYNHLMDESAEDRFTTLQKAGMFKVDYTFRY
jgi:hypothetical protein